jgi:hypothetical protein
MGPGLKDPCVCWNKNILISTVQIVTDAKLSLIKRNSYRRDGNEKQNF